MCPQPDAFWVNLFKYFGYDYVRPLHKPTEALRRVVPLTQWAEQRRTFPELSEADLHQLQQRGRFIFYNAAAITPPAITITGAGRYVDFAA